MFKEALIPFIAIALSELGDKTQLAVFCLSAKTNKKIGLLFGVLLAFLITSIIAAFFGGFLSSVVPRLYLAIGSGILFILFGIVMINKKEEGEVSCNLKHPIISGFSLILISELGDKSQITTALFSANMNPFFVFIGAFLALAMLSGLAVYLGGKIATRINGKKVSLIAGYIFILLGLLAMAQAIFL